MLFDDSIPGLVTVSTDTGLGIQAQIPVRKGQRLYRLQGCLCSAPTRYSVQVSSRVHIEPGGAAWRHINHSCEPNLVIDFFDWRFRTVRDIGEDEQLTFNYLNTERELITPFECRCGARHCLGFIGGYARLEAARRLLLQDHLADHLRDLPLDVPTYQLRASARTLTPASFGIES